MTEQIKLSLCMITNNDELFIHDCLQTVKDIADEIIIVDIGSIDNTIVAASLEGAQVYHVQWNNDFSELKNFFMDHSRGQWVLFLQPNETISKDHLEKIKTLLDNPNAEAYLMLINYNSESFNISSPVQSLRLLRNHQENRFCYRSFEAIPDEKFTGVVNSTIEIVQQEDAMISWELNLRYAILQEESDANPQDSYLQYMLGLIKLNQSSFEESIVCFQNARSGVNAGYLFAPHLYKCLGWAYLYLEQYDEAIIALSEGIELCPFYTDLLILRAELYKQLKQYDNAFDDLILCLTRRQCPNLNVPIHEISDSYLFALLGELSEILFDDEKALMYYLQAYQMDDTDIELLYKIGDLIEITGLKQSADDLIGLAVKKQNPDMLITILKMLQKFHAYETILTRMNNIASVLGDQEAMIMDISCRLMAGTMPDEIDVDDCSFDIVLRRIENCWLHNNWSKAEELSSKLDHMLLPGLVESDLLHNIHQVLTRGGTASRPLTQQAYSLVALIHDDFLWRGQEKKAKVLLPTLLDQPEEDINIRHGLSWAKTGDFDVIKTIFSHILSDEKKTDFIGRVTKELLRHDHPATACQVKNLDACALPEALERLLWVSLMSHDLQESMTETARTGIKTQAEIESPDDLACFYQILCSRNECINSSELTVSEIHEKIGDHYLAANKKAEALSAYLKALQIEPLNFMIQQRVLNLVRDIPTVDELLGKLESVESANRHIAKGAFVHFIGGLKVFYDGLFQQALVHFSKLANNTAPCRLFDAYAAACLWLDQNSGGITLYENRTRIYSEAVIRICFHYLLSFVRKEPRQYHEIYQLMDSKIYNLISTMNIRDVTILDS